MTAHLVLISIIRVALVRAIIAAAFALPFDEFERVVGPVVFRLGGELERAEAQMRATIAPFVADPDDPDGDLATFIGGVAVGGAR